MRCDVCNGPSWDGAPLKTYGVVGKGGHAMHDHCRQEWLEQRRNETGSHQETHA
jgi:hypothetical protein